MSSDSYFVPILPGFDGFFSALDKGAKEGGSKAGKTLSDELSKGLTRSQGAVDKATQQVERARQRAADAADKTRVAELKLSEVMDKGNASAVEVAKATADYNKARREQESTEKAATRAAGNLSTAQDDLSQKTRQAADSIEAAGGASADTERDVESLKAELDELGSSVDGASQEMIEASERSEKFGKALDGVALGVVAMGAAAGAGLVKLGTDFDSAYNTIRTGTGASGEAFEGLKDSALSVMDVVPAMDGGMDQIATTLADLNTRLGLTGEPLEEMTAQFVALSNMGVDADINEISAAMSQFGIETEAMPGMMDSLFQISQATGLSMTELTSSLSKSGPALQELGFSLEESAGLLGQLDKAGLNSEQMMGSMTKALQGFAKAGEDPQEALWGTISSIEELQAAGKDAEAIDLANSVFGPKGGAQFVSAVKDGQFAWDDFMGSIGATDDTILGLAEETRTMGESLELMKQQAMVAIEPLAMSLMDQLIPAIEQMGKKLQDAIAWVQENEELVKTLAVTVGVAAGAFVAWRGVMMGIAVAQKVFQVATALSTVGIKGMNAAMRANVIGVVVTALAGLVAGLTYFFTQTETGKAMWETFTSTMSESWTYTVETLSAGWTWLVDNVFSPMGGWWDGLKFAWSDFTRVLGEGWQATKDMFAAGWSWIQENVFDAFGRKMLEVEIWWKNTTGQLAAAWQDVQTIFSAVWEGIKTAVFDAWNWYVDRVKANWELVTTALSTAWTWVKDTFMSVWNTIKAAVFDAWNAYVNQVKANWDTVTGALNAAWEGVRSVFGTTWDWIRDNVFSKFNSAIDLMRTGAEIAMDGIGKAFDWLREKTAKPVNFVIETVYMGGIRKAWGAVASLVDLEELPEVKKIGGYAQGTARIPGARTPYDNVHMVSQDGRFGISLRGGEGVLVPEAVDGLGEGAVNALNHAGIHGGKPAVDRVLNALDLGRFARGGFIDLGGFNLGGVTNLAGNLSAIQRSHAQFVGRFFPDLFNLTSAGRQEPGSFHDFGSMAATDWQAKDGQFASQMPTRGSKALAKAIFTNFGNSAELIHYPLDGWQNINDGAPYDYGPGTNAGHRNHVHWATRNPLRFDGDNIVLDDAGGGFFETITNMAKRLWDGVVDKIPGFPGADTLGKFGQLPAAFLKKAASSAWEFIKSKADAMMPFGRSVGGGAEQWRGLASQALKRMGYGDEYLDAMLQQIQIESTGDPNAQNNWDSNALRGTPSRGLLQVIDPTYRDVRNRYPEAFEGLPDDPTHPLTNLVAGVGAVKRDWGGPGGRWPTKDGYHEGGLAPAGQGLMHKTALEPEMVLSPAMTKAFIDWMRGTPGGESASVVAKEFAEAFHGRDWGMGELASYIGEDLAMVALDVVAAVGKLDRGFQEWVESEDVAAARARFADESSDAALTAGRGLATESLDLVGLGGLVELAEGVGTKLHGIAQDEEVREAVKKVQLDPDMSYSGREIEKKLRELGVDVERIKSQLSGSVLGGLVGMA